MGAAVDLSDIDRQENWILQSASASRSNPTQNSSKAEVDTTRKKILQEIIESNRTNDALFIKKKYKKFLRDYSQDLIFQRVINEAAPNLLQLNLPSQRWSIKGSSIAIILCGELRCLAFTKHFFKSLSKHADLFICTNKRYEEEACQLAPRNWQRKILVNEPKLPVGSMHQWHKLSICIDLMRQHEKRRGYAYSHFIKLRTDYLHVNPSRLVDEIKNNHASLLCASDKVFSGPRILGDVISGFYQSIPTIFDHQSEKYWPINVQQILASDDCIKWYGMRFPPAIVGRPQTVDELRSLLSQGGNHISEKLRSHFTQPLEGWHTHCQGHKRFPSELCFARYLNFCNVVCKSNPAFLGFLISNRHKQ